jgi:indole-3-acetate monooxygenase
MVETDHFAAARRLEPLVALLRDRLDHERRLPDEPVQAIHDAGLFSMWLPHSVGGAELPPLAFLEVIEELSRQDGSVGWCTAIAAGHSRFAGALSAQVAQEIFGSSRIVLAGALNPVGTATAVSGGYRVSGRWGYDSGIDHSQWVYGNCVMYDESGPRCDANGAPSLRLCLFLHTATEVIDTWHVSGLRGTGSHDFQAADLFVPEEHTVPLARFSPVATQPGAIYAVPMAPIFSSILAAVMLGIARAAIDALTTLANGKTPVASQTVLREKALAQADVARAEALVRGGRAYLFNEVEAMWQDVLAGRDVTVHQRALVLLAACEVARQAVQAVDLAFAAAGGTAIREGNRMERCFRDIHAAAQHIGVSAHSNLEPIGRVLFGLAPGVMRF